MRNWKLKDVIVVVIGVLTLVLLSLLLSGCMYPYFDVPPFLGGADV